MRKIEILGRGEKGGRVELEVKVGRSKHKKGREQVWKGIMRRTQVWKVMGNRETCRKPK